MELRRLLVPLDGTEHGEHALGPAEQLAARADAELILARVPLARIYFDPDAAEVQERAVAEAEQYLRGVLGRLQARGIRCRAVILDMPGQGQDRPLLDRILNPMSPLRQVGQLFRDAADAIALAADAHEVDLIVMATHERGQVERRLYGGVTREVLHRASAPVLLVPRDGPDALAEGEHFRAVAVLDGSVEAEAILPSAAAITRLQGGSLILVQAVPEATGGIARLAGLGAEPAEHAALEAAARSYLDAVAGRLPDLAIETVVVDGEPDAAVARVAEEQGCALVSVATHGRTGLTLLTMGDVAESIIAAAPCLALTIRPTGAPEQQVPAAGEPASSETTARETVTAPPLTLTLTGDERELLKTALLTLRQTAGREDHLGQPIQGLLTKLDAAERA
jgi:nucleotide-binding universal stress UspA family protein